MTLSAQALIALSLFFAAFVHGSVGFGSAVIAVPFIALILGIKIAVPFVAPYSLLIALFLLWHARGHLEWRHVGYPIAATVCGVPVGVWMLKSLSPHAIEIMLGVFMLAYVAWSIPWKRTHFVIHRVRLWGIAAGFTGGVFCGSIAMPGPPAAIFVSATPWSKQTMRGALQAYIIFSYALTLVIFGGTGMLDRDILWLNLFHLPSVVLGMAAGQALFHRIPHRWFVRGVLAMLTVLGFKLCW